MHENIKTSEELARKYIEELQDKLAEGWKVEAVYRNKYVADGKTVLVVEIELITK